MKNNMEKKHKIKEKKEAIILGAGISGLTVGYRLMKAGYHLTFIEKEDKCGGTIVSKKDNSFSMDFGPNSGLDTSPYFHDMLEDIDIKNQLLYADERAKSRFILKNDQLIALPSGPLSLLATSLFSMKGKLGIIKEPFVSSGKGRETISEFVQRRFGKEMLDYAINPFISGIYAGDPNKLSVREAFPKLYALEEKYGSVIKGAIRGAKERKKRKEKSKISSKMFSFREGMQALPKGIENFLVKNGAQFIYNADVEKVIQNGDRYQIEYKDNLSGAKQKLMSEKVILSVPANSAAKIIQNLDMEFSRMIQNIFYPAILVLFIVFREKSIQNKKDGFGFLIPERENKSFLGAIFSSTLFPSHIYANNESLLSYTIFAGGARNDFSSWKENSEYSNRLTKNILNELKRVLKIKGDPVYSQYKFWPRAIPQYNMEHYKIIEQRKKFEENFKGLFIRANYVDGISLSDCISAGFRKAEEIIQIDEI